MTNKSYIQFDILKKYKSLFHFSTTIYGGVSQGNYSTFNLGLYSGDNTDSVRENRKRLTDMLNVLPTNIYTPYQTHESKVYSIDANFLSKSQAEQTELLNGIDAVITNQRNICIGISTADCVPILIYDPIHHALGCIHAGWRGTVAKIVLQTIDRMKTEYNTSPIDLIAAIGPSISQKNFEVGKEVVDSFIASGFNINDIMYRNAQTKKAHIDLQAANKQLLIDMGIKSENIEISYLCTFENPLLFFSARRQTIHSGRMVTGGVLR